MAVTYFDAIRKSNKQDPFVDILCALRRYITVNSGELSNENVLSLAEKFKKVVATKQSYHFETILTMKNLRIPGEVNIQPLIDALLSLELTEVTFSDSSIELNQFYRLHAAFAGSKKLIYLDLSDNSIKSDHSLEVDFFTLFASMRYTNPSLKLYLENNKFNEKVIQELEYFQGSYSLGTCGETNENITRRQQTKPVSLLLSKLKEIYTLSCNPSKETKEKIEAEIEALKKLITAHNFNLQTVMPSGKDVRSEIATIFGASNLPLNDLQKLLADDSKSDLFIFNLFRQKLSVVQETKLNLEVKETKAHSEEIPQEKASTLLTNVPENQQTLLLSNVLQTVHRESLVETKEKKVHFEEIPQQNATPLLASSNLPTVQPTLLKKVEQEQKEKVEQKEKKESIEPTQEITSSTSYTLLNDVPDRFKELFKLIMGNKSKKIEFRQNLQNDMIIVIILQDKLEFIFDVSHEEDQDIIELFKSQLRHNTSVKKVTFSVDTYIKPLLKGLVMPNVSELSLMWCNLSKRKMEYLFDFTSHITALESLHYEDAQQDNYPISQILAYHPKLRHVALVRTLHPYDFELLSRLKKLESLNLSNNNINTCIKGLCELSTENKIDCFVSVGGEIDAQMLARAMENITNIKTLTITRTSDWHSLENNYNSRSIPDYKSYLDSCLVPVLKNPNLLELNIHGRRYYQAYYQAYTQGPSNLSRAIQFRFDLERSYQTYQRKQEKIEEERGNESSCTIL